jgi:hypothetical protein
LGHLTPVAFDDSFVVQAHPKQNKDMTAIRQKIITPLRIETIPSFLSYSFFAIMREILRSINPSKKLCHLKIKSALVFMDLKFKSAPFFNLTKRHNLKKPKGGFRLCPNCTNDLLQSKSKSFLTVIQRMKSNESISRRSWGSREDGFSYS